MKAFYHSVDLDGHCSGAIAALVHPGIRLMGIDHGDPFPWELIEVGERVYMLDFSLPEYEMMKLNTLADLVWIDHHKSAMAWDGSHIEGVRKDGRAACELTWRWMAVRFPERLWPATPLAVRFLGRYDVHDLDNPNVLPFQYGMRLHRTIPEETPDFWQRLFYADIGDTGLIEEIVKEGNTVLEYVGQYNAKVCRAGAFETVLDGLRFIAVNAPIPNSKIFESVYDDARHDGMICFTLKRNGKWAVHLYTDRPEIDVSAIAIARGGGGHKYAAGFICTELPFEVGRSWQQSSASACTC